MNAQGWYRDPYGIHNDRWFSNGQPTKLVRDEGVESYDPPPPQEASQALVRVAEAELSDGNDLLRADDPRKERVNPVDASAGLGIGFC